MLGTLGKTFGVNYVLPAGLGQARLSVNLMQATPERALQTIVGKAGLRAEKRGATWYISQPEAVSPRGADNAAPFAQMGPMGGMPGGGMFGGGMPGGGMFPGMVGGRQGGGPNPAGIGDLGAPGGVGGFGAPPGRGQQQPTQTAQQGAAVTRQLSFVVIPIFRASPSVLGQAIGFDSEIWDDSSGGGGGGGGGNSGYGGGQNSGGNRGGNSGGGRSGGGGNNRNSNSGNSNRSY
jgi:hypothetical protein